MRSLNRVGSRSISLPLLADDIVEFHASRLLLLLNVCGTSGRIDSLTKMAKLDFFARYPDFFEAARAASGPREGTHPHDLKEPDQVVESAMVRHHYGPWDKRYYHVLAHLESKHLITVRKQGRSYQIELTDSGHQYAKTLEARPSFAPLVERMRRIKKTFGKRSGTYLKDLIYRLFDAEVGQRPMGKVIHL